MLKLTAILTLLLALSLTQAETLSAEVNKPAYDYALAMFEAADVTLIACPAEQRERTGFFYLCGKTTLEPDALETLWTSASADYGGLDDAGDAITADGWSSVGSGRRGLELYVGGEFVIGAYGPNGDVFVQSGKTY